MITFALVLCGFMLVTALFLRFRDSYTFVEFIIVLSIIGLLSAIAIQGFQEAQKNAKKAELAKAAQK